MEWLWNRIELGNKERGGRPKILCIDYPHSPASWWSNPACPPPCWPGMKSWAAAPTTYPGDQISGWACFVRPGWSSPRLTGAGRPGFQAPSSTCSTARSKKRQAWCMPVILPCVGYNDVVLNFSIVLLGIPWVLFRTRAPIILLMTFLVPKGKRIFICHFHF
jgi:hypothetical protein